MQQFPDRHHVRLRCRVHGTYLHADEDGRGVSLRPRSVSRNLAWGVHLIQGDRHYVRLHGAYGRYLAATDTQAPFGHRGHLAAQREFDEPEDQAIMWRVIRSGPEEPDDVLLLNFGGRYLRANGRFLPWHTGVTVDSVGNLSTMFDWVVEAIPRRQTVPSLPAAAQQQQQQPRGLIRRRRRSVSVEPSSRVIRYVEVGPDGSFAEEAWRTLDFTGRSVFRLRFELAQQLGVFLFFYTLILCVRAGGQARLTPLVVDLPSDNDTLDIVILTTGSIAAGELWHPDVDAE